jgi:purine nucleoside phosphorylase
MSDTLSAVNAAVNAAVNTTVNAAVQAVRAVAPTAAPRIAVVLGSGWGGVTSHIHKPQRIAYQDLPGFPQATVAGHAGELWLGQIGGHEVPWAARCWCRPTRPAACAPTGRPAR